MKLDLVKKIGTRVLGYRGVHCASQVYANAAYLSDHLKNDIGMADLGIPHLTRPQSAIVVQDTIIRFRG